MAKIITFFSHKGGVGKTTTAHNVATALTKIGKNVLLIDADSQMNLTSAVLGLSDSIEYADDNESKWVAERQKYTNISDFLEDYISKDLKNKEPEIKLYDYDPNRDVDTKLLINDYSRGRLSLLLGSVNIFKLETRLYSIVTNNSLRDDSTIFKIQEAIEILSAQYDFVIIDTSPSATSILNGIFVMMSSYFLSPMLPNFFSKQALDNMEEIIKNWVFMLENFRRTPNRKGLNFSPKFLGIVINMAKRFKTDKQEVTNYAEKWKDKLNSSIESFYRYAIDNDRVLQREKFASVFEESTPFIISEVCDFTGQIRSVAEVTGFPVLDLNNDRVKIGCEKMGITTFPVEGKGGHYKDVFKELTSSYTYIARCFAKLP